MRLTRLLAALATVCIWSSPAAAQYWGFPTAPAQVTVSAPLTGNGTAASPLACPTCATGSSGVTSVGLSLPNIFTVSGSPVTTTGTLTGTLASQTQNQAWMSPNGSSGAPGFRGIVNADLVGSGAVTVNTSGPLGGGGSVALGASLTLTCSTCVTSVTASAPIASSGGATPNISLTGIVGVANGGTGANTLTLNGVVYGNGTSAANITAQGAANSILTANAGAPSFSQTPTINTSVTVGVNASQTGSVVLANGGASGLSVTVQNPSATTAYNFNLPATAGNVGQAMVSQGGGSTAMTWATHVATVKKQIFTASGTYTPSTGMMFAVIEAVGSGGGGGGTAICATANSGAGGGGSGGYARSLVTAATVGASQTVTVGAAGTAGAAGANNGGAGGDVSVGALVIAKGGSGGGGAASGASGAGGGAATGTGDLTTVGNSGMSGMGASITTVSAFGGGGGAGFFGGSQGTSPSPSAGCTSGTGGSGFGSGGNGAACSGSASNTCSGGAGSKGIVIITEYCSQ